MFWIPIMILVCIILGITSLPGEIRGAKNKIEYNDYQEAEKRLAAIAEDRELESSLYNELGYKIDEWKQIVQEFMGGNPEWADYTDYTCGKTKATIILMARRGKLPSQCIHYGKNLPLDDETRLKPGPHQIRPERGIQMNEDFMLRVEQEMCQRLGRKIVVYVWTTMNGESRSYHMSLRDFQKTYGYGKTHYYTRFQFIAENS